MSLDLHLIICDNLLCFLPTIPGIFVSCGVMPIALLDPNEDASIENFLSDNEAASKFKQAMYLNPRLIKSCELIFPFLDNKGAFDA